MDDLDLLARLRADVPELDPFAERRIRNRLLLTAAAHPSTATGPAAGTAQAATGPAPGTAQGAGTGPAGTAPGAGSGRDRRRRRTGAAGLRLPVRVGVAVAAAAAVLLTGTVLAGRTDGGVPVGATAAAAEVLDRAATTASRAELLPAPGPDQVLYRRELGAQVIGTMGDVDVRGGPLHPCASVHEMWMPADPAADRTMRRSGGMLPRPGNADPATMPRDPLCGPYGSFAENLGPATGDEFPGPRDLAELPTDPQELYEQIRRYSVGQGASDAEGTLVNLVQLASMASPFLSPERTAAVYRAMKYVPGVQLLGPGKDMLGRSGTVLGRVEPVRGYRQEVVLDPNTGRMLGGRDVVVDPAAASGGTEPSFPVGTPLWQSVITTSVVDAVDQRPPA